MVQLSFFCSRYSYAKLPKLAFLSGRKVTFVSEAHTQGSPKATKLAFLSTFGDYNDGTKASEVFIFLRKIILNDIPLYC